MQQNKEIVIPKPQPSLPQKINDSQSSVSRDRLKNLNEFSKEEIIGIINLNINDLINSIIKAENILRAARTMYSNNSKEKDLVAITESSGMIDEMRERIAEQRQLRSEIEQGKYVI